MSEKVECRAAGDPVVMAALNELVEAYLEASGTKASREFLKAIAARVASAEPEVVSIRDPMGARNRNAARVWLQHCLPGWISKHG